MLNKEDSKIFQEYSLKLRMRKNKLLKECKDNLDKQEDIKLIEYYKILNINIEDEEEKYGYLSNLYFSQLDEKMSEVDIDISLPFFKSYIDINGYRRYLENDN